MFHRLFFAVIFIVVSSCTYTGREKPSPEKKITIARQKHTVAILPFTGTDSLLISGMMNAMQEQLAVEFSVLPVVALPPFAYYRPRQRYIADSLLVFLKNINQGRFEKIIGITTKDISTRKGEIGNWGILGLGFCPGVPCIISTFRAGRNKIVPKDFLRRMTTLALHELGHTYGLEHCASAACLMKDANGKMNLDDGDSYCVTCKNYLLTLGILK